MILKQLQIFPAEFGLQQLLCCICKKQSLQKGKYQIDVLSLQQKINEMQLIQQKTCQQIVQFVDQHCAEYIQINSKFQSLQQQITNVSNIIELINNKVKDYCKIYYKTQANIQQTITNYQTQIVQTILLSKCKQQSQFLSTFLLAFESIVSKPLQLLSFKEKTLLMRFCYKFKYLQNLFNHHLLHQALTEYLKINQLLTNFRDQVQFYLSQQLSRLAKYKSQNNQNKLSKDLIITTLGEIKLYYTYLTKLSDYYKNIQQNLTGRQMNIAEKNLINNKTNLIVGKNIEVLQEYFRCLFSIVSQFPQSYPRERILELVFNHLKKNQVKFLYTYTFAIFPIAYNIYIKCVEKLNYPQLINLLKLNHNWDLKRWIDVRQTNILDRSQKDWEKGGDLIKWIDIIFKDNCKIEGVKTQFVKLALKIVSKYAKFMQQTQFSEAKLNKFVQIYKTIESLMQEKIKYYFSKQGETVSQQAQKIAFRISNSVKNILQKSINQVIYKNTKFLIKSCQGCLEPQKSFIMKIIKLSKEYTQNGFINSYPNVFKPLNSYLNNSETLSNDTKNLIVLSTLKEVSKHYDEIYVSEIYQYSKNNLSVQQLSQVMETVGKQRKMLFEPVKYDNKKQQEMNEKIQVQQK